MALVTVQRSPSPSCSPETESLEEEEDEVAEETDGEPKSPSHSQSFSESYLAVKGAALILPQSECARTVTDKTNGGDIGKHLQSMFYLLRPQDTIKVAVKLESAYQENSRYLALVSTLGRQDTEECLLLGIDIENKIATVGLVLPMWSDLSIELDGNGSALQSLNKVRDEAIKNNYYAKGLTHTWVSYYEVRSKSNQNYINEWNKMEDLESTRKDKRFDVDSLNEESLEKAIRTKLKEIMMTVDLEEVTSKFLRLRLEEEVGCNLKHMGHFIDNETISIMGQMDAPSQIFDFLYLGSEWNASNLEELKQNGVKYILNVTREIDNFFPELFEYNNIRLRDEESSELMKHWDDTFKFINKARKNGSKVLVHCKMGVSRSASTVMAFAMKEYGWDLDHAYQHVKQKRTCVKPNAGFMQQLRTYEGILDASKQRHNKLWRSASVGSLPNMAVTIQPFEDTTDLELDLELGEIRPRSWSPSDNMAQILLKTQHLASDGESTEEEELLMDTRDEDHAHDTPPHIPLLYTLDNWEDYEISSRSADSLDECFSELPEPIPSNEPKEPVVLVAYTTSVGHSTDGVNYDTTPLDSDSDCDHIEVDEERYQPFRGFYDVTMLTGCHDPHDVVMHIAPGDDDDEEYFFLHPDVKLEYMISQARKQLRIAKLIKLSQAINETQKAQVVKSALLKEKSESFPLNSRSNTPAPLPVKLKPDDFWIKDIPVSPGAGNSETKTDEELLPLDLMQSKGFPSSNTTSEAAEQVVTHDAAEECSKTPNDEVLRSSSAESIDTVEQYVKEDIPWSPGTVKRTAHELLTKYCDKTIEKTLCGLVSSSSSEEDIAETCSNSTAVSDIESPIKSELTLSETKLSSVSKDDGALVDPSFEKDAEPDVKRPVSLYETEDIQLEPGLVHRTCLEIEERERSGSAIELGLSAKDVKPVQRSSSWKTDRESSVERSTIHRRIHHRNSERRRTCLPVLTPYWSHDQSPPGDDSVQKTESTSDDSVCFGGQDNATCTYHIGSEEIEMEKNSVRKRTLDYEGKQDSDKSSDSLLYVTQPDKEHERSLSPFIDETLEIKSGTVQRQKEEIQRKYGSTLQADKSNEDKCKSESSETDSSCGSPVKSCLDCKERCPSLPDENLPWNSGTVRQCKEVFESADTASDITRHAVDERRQCMNQELRELIESVGTAFTDCSRLHRDMFVESPRGKGMVNQLVREIERYKTDSVKSKELDRNESGMEGVAESDSDSAVTGENHTNKSRDSLDCTKDPFLTNSEKDVTDNEQDKKCSKLTLEFLTQTKAESSVPEKELGSIGNGVNSVEQKENKSGPKKSRAPLKSGLAGKVEEAKKELFQKVQHSGENYVPFSKCEKTSSSTETSAVTSVCGSIGKSHHGSGSPGVVDEGYDIMTVCQTGTDSLKESNVKRESDQSPPCAIAQEVQKHVSSTAMIPPSFEDPDNITLSLSAIKKFEELERKARSASDPIIAPKNVCEQTEKSVTSLLLRSRSMCERKTKSASSRQGTSYCALLSPEKQTEDGLGVRKVRKLQGKTHPLSVLGQGSQASGGQSSLGSSPGGRSPNPLYNTM